jgi:hypothetical protein
MRAHDVAGRDSFRWIARCHRLAGAIDAGLLGGHPSTKFLVLNSVTSAENSATVSHLLSDYYARRREGARGGRTSHSTLDPTETDSNYLEFLAWVTRTSKCSLPNTALSKFQHVHLGRVTSRARHTSRDRAGALQSWCLKGTESFAHQ